MVILLKDLGCTCVQAYLAFLDFGTMYNCHVATNGLVLLEILKSLYLRCYLECPQIIILVRKIDVLMYILCANSTC